MGAVNVNDTSVNSFSDNHFSRGGTLIGVVILAAIAGCILVVAMIIRIFLKLQEMIQLKRDRAGHYAYGQRAPTAANQALGRHADGQRAAIAGSQAPEATRAGFGDQWKECHDNATARNAV